MQLVEGVKRCALGSMDIISGTTLCHKLLPAVLQWTLWFPNPSLLKAIPSHTAHIKHYHIPSPSPGRYYNCMFIFISCCLYSLVHYICSCPKFHSRFSNMKLYVFLWFLSLPFSFLLTQSWFELFWNVVIYLIIYYSGIVKQDDLICMEKEILAWLCPHLGEYNMTCHTLIYSYTC